MLNEQRLKSFLVVVRRKSFTDAADELHITQPALSIQMKRLEEYYKAKLFIRRGRSLELTPAGQALHSHAKHILDLMRASQEAISELAGNRATRICVGGGTTSGPYMLAGLLGTFRRFHPEIDIVMRLGRFDELLHMFARDEIEISLSRLPRSVDAYGLQSEPFANIKMSFVASPKHYLCKGRRPTLKQIAAQEQFILTPTGNASRELIEAYCAQRNIQLHASMEFESIEAIKSAVRENFGVSILSEPSIALEVLSNKLKCLDVDGLNISYPLVILYPLKKKLSRGTELFLQFLRHNT